MNLNVHSSCHLETDLCFLYALRIHRLPLSPPSPFSFFSLSKKNSVPRVPASLLKKQKTAAKYAAEKAATDAELKKGAKGKRKDIFKRAEKYAREYRKAERDTIQLKRDARKAGNFHVAAQPKVAILVRIKGINAVAPKVKKVLQLFRLLQINNAVFVKKVLQLFRLPQI